MGYSPWVAQLVNNLPAVQKIWVHSLGWECALEKGIAIHSNILAWKIPWTEVLVGYSSWCHKQSNTTGWLTRSFAFCIWFPQDAL